MKLLTIAQKWFGMRRKPMTQARAKELLGRIAKARIENPYLAQSKWFMGGERQWL